MTRRPEATVPAPGTGGAPPPPGSMEPVHPHGTLELGDLRPAIEGEWDSQHPCRAGRGDHGIRKVLESLQEYTPDKASQITGVNPAVIRQIARTFATAETAMIFAGYRVCKSLHGDLIQRAFMLLLSVTGNLGKPGTGLQIWNMPNESDQLAFMFADLPPTLRIATMSRWDYAKADLKKFNAEIYGEELADEIDKSYQAAIANRWYPDYSKPPWKMGIYFGSNAANWARPASVGAKKPSINWKR